MENNFIGQESFEDNILLDIKGISKTFVSTKAVQNVSFSIKKGEIHGLIGENGSGKSTLVSMIAGVQKPDCGKFVLNGEDYYAKSPVDANEKGVSLIMQEIGTISGISVQSNIFLGKENIFSKHGIMDYKKMNGEAKKILSNIGVDNIDPAMFVDSLNLEERKIIEIAKAATENIKLLIVDETANALTKYGRDILFSTILKMKEKGCSVIFITHDLNELCELCDTVTVLRDGVYIKTLNKDEMAIPTLKRLMVGREMSDNFYRDDYDGACSSEVVLEVNNVVTDVLGNVSFKLHKGEILGFGGIADCGMHEIGKVIFGLDKPVSGSVNIGGGVPVKNTKQAIKNNIGYISKNRDTEALVMQAGINDNICICSLSDLSKFKFLTRRKEGRFVKKLAEQLSIKMRDIHQYVSCLSGGNKQKVVLAKWIGKGSKILIMDCPTRGIDIGVKEAIYKLMMELKQNGHSMIMISEELPELIGMSDRMIIMKNGKIESKYDRSKDITEELLIQDMI